MRFRNDQPSGAGYRFRSEACLTAAVAAGLLAAAVGCDPAGSAESPAPQAADSAVGKKAENLLANGGFEAGDTGPTGWKSSWRDNARHNRPPLLVWDTAVTRTGRRSVQIARAEAPDAARRGVWSAEVTGLRPNTWYELTGFVRLANVTGGGVSLVLGKTPSLPQVGTGSWRRVRVVTKTPDPTGSLTVRLEGARFAGAAWFDDLRLVELPGRPADYPGTPPKRGDEIVSVWMHCSGRWGRRPLQDSPEAKTQPPRFDTETFGRDFREFFAAMDAMQVTDLYGIPATREPDENKKKWGVDLAVDVLYLKACQERGIRVFDEIGGIGRPPDSGDTYKRRSKDGKVLSKGACLTHPEVRAHALRISVLPKIRRIRRYRARGLKIAGLCTDGIRWRNINPCYCDLCRKEFAKVAGRMSREQFRCEPLTEYVRAVRAELKKVDPELMLVGAVKKHNSRIWGQDTPRWLREGIYDYIMPMAYGGPSDWAQTIEVLTKEQGVDPRKIVVLTALYYAGVEASITQIALARQRGIGGVSFFGWRKRHYQWPYSKRSAEWTRRIAEAIRASPLP